jgi:16S rRNA (uracil1498-N3)-methyltransferase
VVLLPRAAAHVFVADPDVPEVDADDRHHLMRVLRLRDGEAVTVADGRGRWRECVWRNGALEPAGPSTDDVAPDPPVTVAFALTKGERPEWVVQKLTEVGVDIILPFRAARSVVRWDETKAAAATERWRRVAREAAMQCRRTRLPHIAPVTDFAGAVSAVGPGGALAAAGGDPPDLVRPAVLVGPEGGWSPDELACGLPAVGLGPTVLRAETAAVAAAVVLCALREGVVWPTRPSRDEGHKP